MKKRITAAAISAAVLFGAVSGQAFAANDSSFTDITSTSSRAQIEALQELGIVKGVSSSEFHPEESLTGAQGVELIVRAMQLSLAAIDFKEAPTAEGFFTNVKNDAWYAESFVIAHYNGLDLPADIDPTKPLTKEQFTHYLVQALEKTGQYPLIKMYINILDEKDINVDYQGTIQRALLYKIVSLDADGNFRPQQVVNRAEAAAVLYGAHQFVETHKDNGEATPESPEAPAASAPAEAAK
ncbi:S-layer homology domain-containing protein [Paenibacillus glycanilyticus]|uniref:S-layer homology domain-containing protein n=1 Tax=Paenibacillus glycanilyticus TaxID=126569 RepID=UPI00203F74A3|nr:S-layer homology domain-containing protein [Paenibacillus glycanilyticus]MCM3629170.1 S-layer homology domain-containing protein [Paenibacillus glycanilyticus]